MQRPTPWLPALILAIAASAAAAQEAQTYDRVDLNASAEREIDNDLLIAYVFAEFEANEQAEAADAVNTAIRWAADRARTAEGIDWQTAQYSTRPVYASNERRIIGWIARQSMRLQSTDQEALSELLGQLQERVAIQSIGTGLSKAARDAAEEALIAEAITAFERRAELVAGELGRPGYRLVYLNVGSSGGFFNPRARMQAFDAAEVAAPEIEAGVQTVTVTVNGTIELEPDR